MSFRRIKAITKKEFLQIWRDPLSLAMAFLMPAVLLVIFGYAINFDIKNITTVIYDRDRTSLSRELAGGFVSSNYFNIAGYIDDDNEIDEYLLNGKARVAVMIPEGFYGDAKTGGANLGVIIDGSDSNTATIAESYVAALVQRFSERLSGVRFTPVIEVRSRVWYNAELESKNFIIPGLIAIILSVISALLTSLTVAREWDRGTMEQLVSTPVKPSELIIGKFIPYFVIGIADTLVAVAMATMLFGVALKGSLALLMGMACIFLFGGSGFGILISIIARTQLLASQGSLVATFLPAFLLSGFIFSISNMPPALQVVTYAIPARYFVKILKSIFMKGSGIELLWKEAAFLSVYGAVVFAIARRKLRKKII